jgi:anti-sigma regulatory factor (Ser/Thr protein kinase)
MTSIPVSSDWDDEPPILGLELDATPDAPSLARAAIVGFCQDCGVSGSALATVMLLVSEITTNAVVHPDVQPPAPIRLRAAVTPEIIRVEIKDQGSGFTPRPRDASRLQGGYGLYLLDKEALRWGVRRGEGTAVWFEVGFGAAGETQAREAQYPIGSPQHTPGTAPPSRTTRANSTPTRSTAPSASMVHRVGRSPASRTG